jgi:hypothetical protein
MLVHASFASSLIVDSVDMRQRIPWHDGTLMAIKRAFMAIKRAFVSGIMVVLHDSSERGRTLSRNFP